MSEKYIARSRAVAARLLDDEMIIMSAADSTLFTLSDVATIIWQCADGRTPLSSIVRNRICREFEVAPDHAYQDAEAFTEQLGTYGILLISDEPISEAGPASVVSS